MDSEDTLQNVNSCFKVLNNVSIPRGAVIDGEMAHYTQYQCVLQCHEPTYFIKPYHSSEVFEVKLTEALLNKEEITYFSIDHPFKTQRLN